MNKFKVFLSNHKFTLLFLFLYSPLLVIASMFYYTGKNIIFESKLNVRPSKYISSMLDHYGTWKIIHVYSDKSCIEITDKNGKKYIAWIIGNNKKQYLVMGNIFNWEGINISSGPDLVIQDGNKNYGCTSNLLKYDEFLSRPNFTLEQIFELLKKIDSHTNIIHGYYQFDKSGNRKNTIIAFYDPLCENCKDAYKTINDLKIEFKKHDADIRWMPVAILSNDNMHAAQELADQLGESKVTNLLREAVDMNTAALAYSMDRERPAVPFFVWHGPDGYGSMLGAPTEKNLLEILKMFEEDGNS